MSVRYTIECDCGTKFGVTPGQAGQVVSCGCGRQVSVPLLRELRTRPVFADSSADHDRPSPRTAGRQSLLSFFGVLLTVVSLLLTGILAVARGRIDTTWSAEGQRDYDSQIIDQFKADEVYSAWHDILHDGLGEKQPNPFMFNRELHDRLGAVMMWSGIASVVFGAGTLVVGLTRRRPSAN